MDSVKQSTVTLKKGKFASTVAKVLHLRAATGVAPVDGLQKEKSLEKVKHDEIGKKNSADRPRSLNFKQDEEMQKALDRKAALAKLFASVSSIKASYAQLQCSQSPYDVDGIQAADRSVVSELKNLSELKKCYMKKQFDPAPETSILLAELQEQKNVSKTYEITGSKLESQLRLKESEIMYLREKLEESIKHNQLLEKRLNKSGQLSMMENLHKSGLSPSHFIAVVQYTVKSVRSFVKEMVDRMKAADWDIDDAANVIVPDVFYWRADDKYFTFESFFSRGIFDGFHLPYFSLSGESTSLERKNNEHNFFRRFTELKSVKVKDYLAQKPKSTFAKFCRAKYLQLIHPRMETSFFGNLDQRNLVNSGGLPDTSFFILFAEVAKRVWLLHCLAFSFEPVASIFQVRRGCRFSEVYMECVAEDSLLSPDNVKEADPPVAFTVFPGFRIGKTTIQCQVYLSPIKKIKYGKPLTSDLIGR